MEDLVLEIIRLINEEESKYSNFSQLFQEEEFFQLKKRLTAKVNEILNKEKLDKWQIRKIVDEIFQKANIELESDSIKKIIFLLITDIINERLPSPSPLAFNYKGSLIPKRNAIITDFELFPFLKETADRLNAEKKHLLVFEIFPDGKVVSEGVSYYLNVIDYILFLLLDKALYEEVISIDKILEEKAGTLTVNEKNLSYLIKFLFLSLYEFFTGKKETLKSSLLNKDLTKSFIKAKKLVKDTFSDKKEKEYLINLAVEDEKLSENRKEYISQEEVQENIIMEAKNRNASEVDKIDAVVWLIGLNNLNANTFLKYFSIEDFIKFLEILEKDIEKEKEFYKNSLENFFIRTLNKPGLMDKEKAVKLEPFIKTNFPEIYPNLMFILGNYKEYLENAEKKDINDELKILYARYKTGEIDEKEFKNWLMLYEGKENIDTDLLNFVRNG